MVVACSNSEGEPDFFFVKVTGEQAQVDHGDFYGAAKEAAEEQDYEGPMVAFDCELDSAGIAIAEHFTWDTADTKDA
jgi:hypothetical protein